MNFISTEYQETVKHIDKYYCKKYIQKYLKIINHKIIKYIIWNKLECQLIDIPVMDSDTLIKSISDPNAKRIIAAMMVSMFWFHQAGRLRDRHFLC